MLYCRSKRESFHCWTGMWLRESRWPHLWNKTTWALKPEFELIDFALHSTCGSSQKWYPEAQAFIAGSSREANLEAMGEAIRDSSLSHGWIVLPYRFDLKPPWYANIALPTATLRHTRLQIRPFGAAKGTPLPSFLWSLPRCPMENTLRAKNSSQCPISITGLISSEGN